MTSTASGQSGHKVLKNSWRMAQGFVKERVSEPTERVQFGPFEFDARNQLLYRDGSEVWLPPRAIGVLNCLLARAGQVVSKQDLLDEVWKDANVSDTSLTEAISLLRQTLGDDSQRPTFIQTIPRRGYRFVASGTTPAVAGASDTAGAKVASAAAETAATAEPIDSPWPAWLPWVLLLACLFALLIVSITASRQPGSRVRPVVRFSLDLPTGVTLDTTAPVALARNGDRVAFAATRSDGLRQLFVRDLDQLEPLALAGTDGAAAPFFSPDARWIGFFADGKLKKLAASGGAVQTLCDAPHPFGATWTDDGTIVFAASITGGLQRISADGGTPTRLTTPDASSGEVRHAWPDFVPDSNAIVFTALPLPGTPEAARVAAVSLASGEVRPLIDAATFPRVMSTGHLLFARDHAIVAAPLDISTFELLGPAIPVLDSVQVDPHTGAALFAVAQAGSLAFTPPPDTADASSNAFRWLNHPESFLLPFPARTIRGFAVSPDAHQIAAAAGDDHRTDIWLQNLSPPSTHTTLRLTSSGQNLEPVWSPDGTRVIFSARRDADGDGPFNLFAKDVPQTVTSATRLTNSAHNQFPSSASAAGLIYVDVAPNTGADLWLLPWNGGAARVLVKTAADEVAGALSPDGRWLAYQSDADGDGHWKLMVRRAGADAHAEASANDAPATQVAETDGGRIEWAGSEGVYVTRGGRLTLITVPDAAVAPSSLIDLRGPDAFARAAGDGQLLLMPAAAPARASAPSSVSIVLEWSRELAAKVPVRTPPPRPLR